MPAEDYSRTALTNDELTAMRKRIGKLVTRIVRIVSMGDPHKPKPLEASLAALGAAREMMLPLVSNDAVMAAMAVEKSAIIARKEAEEAELARMGTNG